MANTTVRNAISIHGTNPQYLIEKVIRSRVYDSLYWKEHCFALNSATLIDNAVKLHAIGGTYANQRPTEFMCLSLKLLQLQPEKEIIMEYLRAEEFKYLRALAAFYVRLTFRPVDVYEVLEPLLEDYRKIRTRAMDGSYSITTMDEFVDQLLTEERVCEIQLPRITQRKVLEETEGLPSRRSKLGRALGVMNTGAGGGDGSDDERGGGGSESEGSEEGEEGRRGRYLSRSPSGSRSPTPERERSPSFYDEVTDDEAEATTRKKKKKVEVVKEGGSDSEGGSDRFVSRSPSPASERFMSRSPSPGSPRVMDIEVDTDRIDGDV